MDRMIAGLSRNRAIVNGKDGEIDPVVGLRNDDPKALRKRGGKPKRGDDSELRTR